MSKHRLIPVLASLVLVVTATAACRDAAAPASTTASDAPAAAEGQMCRADEKPETGVTAGRAPDAWRPEQTSATEAGDDGTVQLSTEGLEPDGGEGLALADVPSSIPTTRFGILGAAIYFAVPSSEEKVLREKCNYNSWAGIGMMECSCDISIKVACITNGVTDEKRLASGAWAKQRCFTDVCKTANNVARDALAGQAYELEKACVAGGGRAVVSGQISYDK
jgi:hypothetical protein